MSSTKDTRMSVFFSIHKKGDKHGQQKYKRYYNRDRW